jgi:hypothetical protein
MVRLTATPTASVEPVAITKDGVNPKSLAQQETDFTSEGSPAPSDRAPPAGKVRKREEDAPVA